LAITNVLRDRGIDPVEVLVFAGIDPDLFTDPDNQITYRARGRLITACVVRTGCPHFGLLFGQQMNLQALGLVGMLARAAPDVRSTLRIITNSLHVHSRGAVMGLEMDQSLAVLSYEVLLPNVEGNDQIGDAAIAMMMNVMTGLCGDRFAPVEVRFAHRAPANLAPYRKVFRAPLRFDASRHALVFSSTWLEVRSPDSDPELQRFLRKIVGALEAELTDDFAEQVRRVLRSAVHTGHDSMDQVARIFSIHPRTVARRLEELGTSFQKLADEIRFETARQLLQHTAMEVAEIADVLGYSRTSAFSRAFERWSGTHPAAWRARRARRT
jgi:AraC-like DNA-binding protein